MKIELDNDVVEILSNIIRNRKSDLLKITRGSCDLERFNNQIFPENDAPHGSFSQENIPVFLNLSEEDKVLLEKAKYIIGAVECTNRIIYRPNSFMPWHTNSDLEGTRIYYTFTLGDAIFRYKKEDKIIDDLDNKKWTARSFIITKENPLWHTIWTNSVRYSFGFRL